MATITMTAPTPPALSIETAGSDTVLAVRFADVRPARDARRLAHHLIDYRMPGVESVDVMDTLDTVDTVVVISYDPHTITRSHLELLVQDAAAHV